MEKTCKDCEHYEFYDGPERASFNSDIAIMICKSKYWAIQPYYRSTVSCTDSCPFTPKKPEKSCETCRYSRRNNKSGKHCGKEFPKEYRNCHSHSSWQPKEKPAQTYDVNQATLDEHKRIGKEYARLAQEKIILDTMEEPKTPKPKENKMNRLKKVIRRYVMGCTLYCTALICIAVNPWVCKLIRLSPAPIPHGDELLDSSKAGHVFMAWFFTALAIAAVVTVIYVFEKITVFVFGKLEK